MHVNNQEGFSQKLKRNGIYKCNFINEMVSTQYQIPNPFTDGKEITDVQYMKVRHTTE